MDTICIPCRRWLVLALCLAAAPTSVYAQLTLPQAVANALEKNPILKVFPLRQQAAEARRETANLLPGYSIGIEAENLAGSGEYSGANNAEYTLSIGSVIELLTRQ